MTQAQTRFTTQGLVIKEMIVGESDRLVTLFTREFGVIKAFASGAKSIKSKKGSATSLLTYSSFTILRKKESLRIYEATPITTFFEMGTDVLFLCQKAEELDLYGTVDGAVCCMDSLNHITSYKDFCKALEKVSLFLEKDKLFIFDVNTEYKHKEVLGDNIFVIDREDVYCVWANEYSPKNNMVNISLDFFVKEDDVYNRYYEEFSERAYSYTEIENAFQKAGLHIVKVFDDMTETPVNEQSERAIFITKKV